MDRNSVRREPHGLTDPNGDSMRGRSSLAALACLLLMGAIVRVPAQLYPDTLWVRVIFYDYHTDRSNPEFEVANNYGLVTGMVRKDSLVYDTHNADFFGLDSLAKPVYNPDTVRHNRYIDYWYRDWETTDKGNGMIPNYQGSNGLLDNPELIAVDHDTAMTNVVIRDSLPFLHLGGGVYEFRDHSFFWLDGRGFGNDCDPNDNNYGCNGHNMSFAMELHTTFTLKRGLTFNFSGDDDVWAFINGELWMDLGGIHQEEEGAFVLDSATIAEHGLVEGQDYSFDFFYAERSTRASHIWITTNIVSTHIVSEVTIEADPDSAIVPAGDTVDFTGWVWYDSTGDDGITHHLRDTSLSDQITWSFTPSNANSSLSATVGSQTSFTSTEAYGSFTVTATYEDETGLIVSESMDVRILPNVADHLVIEASHDTSAWSLDMLRNDQPLDTLRIPTTTTTGTAYAILRDRYGNFVNWSQHTDWTISAGTVLAGLVGEDGNVGRVTATKAGHSGIGEITGQDTDYSFTDLVPVRVSNDPIVANDDAYSTQEDVSLTVRGLSVGEGVLVNDVDDDAGTTKRAVLVDTIPGHFLSFGDDGSFTYVPAEDFNGVVSFRYAATDGEFYDTATVTITIGGTNDPPSASPDNYTTSEDVVLNVNAASGVLSNDSDPDGDDLTAVLVQPPDPARGSVVLQEDGSFTFTPAEHFHGTATFSYQASDGSLSSAVTTVTITVTSENDVPIATDDEYTTDEDVDLSVDVAAGVLSNDVDHDGDPLTVTVVSDVAHGTLTLQPTGAFDYDPATNFYGTDEFTYRVSDGAAGDTGTVRITVNPINDAPVAMGDNYSLLEDDSLSVTAANGVLQNDTDPDGPSMSAVLVDDVTEGTLSLASDGSFDYTPPPDYNGTVTFTYLATDGQRNSPKATVILLVQSVNDTPSAANDAYSTSEDVPLSVSAADGVLSNDDDIDGDPLTATLVTGIDPAQGMLVFNADGSFEYTPALNYTGWFTFTYAAADGDVGSATYDTATVTISVGEDNDPPVAVDDSYTVDEDGALTRTAANGVRSNDSDPNGDSLTVSLVEGIGASEGSLTLGADGSFSYEPPANFDGTVTFRYQLNDGRLNSNIATATITVSPVNDVPTAADDQYGTNEDEELVVPSAGVPGILANDNDIDGDALTAVLVDGVDAAEGTLVLRSAGSFVYTPAGDFNGTVTFTYRATDGADTSGVATVTIVVDAVNDAPVLTAIPDQDTTKGSPFRSFDLDDYVSDADHTDAQLEWSVTGGSVVEASIDDATHVVTVTVTDSLWDGTERLVFTVTDPSGASRADTVSFTIRELGTLATPATDTAQGTYVRSSHAMNLYVAGQPEAKIYYTYTTDGTVPPAPTTSSPSLTGSGLVDFGTFTGDSTRVRVRAYAARYPYESSPVRAFEYLVVFPQLPQVVGMPGPGTHNVGELEVELEVPGHPDATIRYTTDGSDPATSATAETYEAGTPVDIGPFSEVTTVQIRAHAVKEGYKPSGVELEYELNPDALPRPVANPPGHVFDEDTVWVTLTVPGADSVVIRYSTDGNTPNENSEIYDGPIPITDSTVLKAVAYKEGNKPGPVMTETYIKSIPTDLEIYPSLTARDPYGITVQCSAGIALPLVARIFDQRDSALTKYESASAPISWTIQEIEGQDPGTLTETDGYESSFMPIKAYTTLKVIATFSEGGVTFKDEITLVVTHGKPYKLWLEADHEREVSPNDPNEIDTLKLSSNRLQAPVFAIIRDSLGNYVAPSRATRWAPSAGDIATVSGGRISLGEGVVLKGVRSDVETVSGRDTVRSLPYPEDSVAVLILEYSYDSLRIVVGTSIGSAVDSVVMNTNQDTTIYVLGHRDDGNGWEPVDARWEVIDGPVGTKVSAPPGGDDRWELSPTDTASGRIRVTLGDDTLTTPDTVWVDFTPGPPTRVQYEVITPADSLIAGKPITTVVRLYNDDNKLVRGEWCHPGSLGDAAYDDILGSGGRPLPTVEVDDSSYTVEDQGVSVDQCITTTGIDTVEWVLYYAPASQDSAHVLKVDFGGGLTASTDPFILLPGDLDSIGIELLDSTEVDSILLHTGQSVVLVAIGYDAYGNRRGRETSDWSVTDSLHAIKTPDNTPQIYYSTAGVTDNEAGYVIATAPDPAGNPVVDSVWMGIVGPKAQLDYSFTRDTDGDGLLDGIELHFNKPVTVPDSAFDSYFTVELISREISSGVVNFTIDSVTTASGGDADSVITLHIREFTAVELPQTALRPSVSVGGLPEANNVSSQKALDGAGPVVWSVVKVSNSAGDKTKDRVTVVFSEPITGPGGDPFSATNAPGDVLKAWASSGGSLVPADSILAGIEGFIDVTPDSVVFLMTNGLDLTSEHFFSIDSLNGLVVDNSPAHNGPQRDNQKERVLVRGALGNLVIGPNPITPTFFIPPEEGGGRGHQTVLKTHPAWEVYKWVKGSGAGGQGGAAIVADFVIPSGKDGQVPQSLKVKAWLMVFDAIGNLVHSRREDNSVVSGEWLRDAVPGERKQLVFYWNGITDRDRRAAPGIYRVLVFVEYGSEQQRYISNVGVGR